MDKLLQISRQGGYPLCAETLQVLYDNARAVNVLLAGLGLPNNSAILLGVENPHEALNNPLNGYRYLYAVSNYKKRLVRYTVGTGVSLQDLSSAKATITETVENVHNTNGDIIEQVYTTERAVIENTNVESERWKFYKLEDVLEFAIYKDLLPEFRAQIANTSISLDDSYENMLCKNEKKLRVKLSISNYPGNVRVDGARTVTMPMPGITGLYQFDAMLYVNDRWYRVEAFGSNETLTLYTGNVYSSINSNPWYASSGQRILINSEILL